MNPVFENATIDDIPVLIEMVEEFYAHEGITFDYSKTKATLAEFISNEQLGRIWLIKYNQQLAGYCCLTLGYTLEFHGRDCFIDELYIKPPFQNKGIGSRTLAFIEEYAAKNTIKAVHLFVFDENQIAFHTYKKNGYVIRGGKIMVKKP